MEQQSLIYSFVARGTAILSEYTEFTGNFTSIASQCLQKLPSTNNKFTYNCDGHTFNYLVEDGFTYCVVAVESAGHQLPMAFLERIKEAFTKRYAGGKAATAVANSLNKEFGPKQKEQMQYCVDHPDEISKLAKVKAQVSEVKGIMMENIEKVLDRGEKIELLVDKTENLRSQDTIINKIGQTFIEGKGLRRFDKIYEVCRSADCLVVICCSIWEEVECLYTYLKGKQLNVIRFHEELQIDANSDDNARILVFTGHLYDQWRSQRPFVLLLYNLPMFEDYKRRIIRAVEVSTFLNEESCLNGLAELMTQNEIAIPPLAKQIHQRRTSLYLTVQRFQELLAHTKYKEAAELAAESFEGILRTPDTVAKFQSVPVQAGQTPPLLQYFGALLTKGKLNAFESLELSRLVVNQNKKNLLENWLAEEKLECVEEFGDLLKNRNKKNLLLYWLHEEKLECSEELGDIVKTIDDDLALKFYIKARATPKVVAALAERREFEKILIYSEQVGYTSDYLFLVQTILRPDPQSVPVQAGQTPPLLLLQYVGTLITNGKLNEFESLELSRLVVNQNKKNLLENLLTENKLQCSEELGNLVKTVDDDLALKIYIKASATAKVVASFAERKEFDKILIYSKQVGYTPDYLFLLQKILRSDPQGAVNFALMMSQLEGVGPIDYNTITDLFLQRNLIREATTFLLDVLKPDMPEHAFLQTKVLEINLVTFPSVADAILANGIFSHYDRPRIAQLCEKAGLFVRALQHYAELPDIKRVIVNTHAIEPRSLVEFFGTLSKEWALECMELVLVYLRGNSQITVLVAKEYSEKLGVDACIKLFEQFKSYEGLYFFLGSYLSSSEDPDIHFKYIEAAAMTGQIKEVERLTRESNFYDVEKTKKFLMEAMLTDAQPLINVCDRFGFVPDLTHYLYTKNMLRYIKGYVQKVNPGNTPLVVGQLLDDECSEDFIKDLILSVCNLLPVEPLVDECEKRNRLCLLAQFVEHLVGEGSQDVHVHNTLGKIIIDSNNNPGHFLTTNSYYDSRVLGKYCETRDPKLSVVAYRRGQCGDELVDVTNKNSLFNLQARYVVERMDGDLWEKVLNHENEFRRQLIDEIVSDNMLQSRSQEQFFATVNAFLAANLPNELIADDEDVLGSMVIYRMYFNRIMR